MQITVNGITLKNITSMKTSDEVIWSSDTARSLDGTMVGDVIAEKKNIQITFGAMPESELKVIKDNLVSGFFTATLHDDGQNYVIEAYRGSLSKDHIGLLDDGIYYYRSATVDIIQR